VYRVGDTDGGQHERWECDSHIKESGARVHGVMLRDRAVGVATVLATPDWQFSRD
jgi:hypothetical protein